MGLKIHGMAELRRKIAEVAELEGGKFAKDMLKAGTKEVYDTWREEAFKRHKLTGNMYNNIKSSNPRSNKYGRYTVTYPKEYEIRIRRGKEVKVRHAAKAFYLHYGYVNNLTGRRVAGDRWVDKIDEIAEKKSDATMQKMLDQYLKQKGV